MLGFRRAPVLESPDSVRRVAATGMVGRRDQANRATVPPAHCAMLPRLEAKTRPARSETMAMVRSKASRPKPLDIRRPIQGLLRLHARYGLSDCSIARGDLCHEASARWVAPPNRSSATSATDNSLGGTFLHWQTAPSGRTEFSRLLTRSRSSHLGHSATGPRQS